MDRRYMVMPALRMPHENKFALATAIKFIEDYRPDEIIQLGSAACMHCAIINRKQQKDKALAEAHNDIDIGGYITEQLLIPIRSIFSGPILLSGEDIRLLTAIEESEQQRRNDENLTRENKHARSLRNEFDITRLPRRYPLAPGWTALSKTSSTSSPDIPGREAWNTAKRLGTSVLIASTMHLAQATHTVRRGEQTIRSVTGVEIGNLLDLTHPTNKPFRRRTQGFVAIKTNGNTVDIECVPTPPNRS